MKKLICVILFAFAACASSPATAPTTKAAPASQPASQAVGTSTSASNSEDCVKACEQKNMARAVSADMIAAECAKTCS